MELTRREVIGGALAAVAAGGVGAAAAQDGRGQPPDVVLLTLEDVSPVRMGCYGNTVCKTPNIDRLAAGGVRFDKAHTSPPCLPSRCALLSGVRPETSGLLEIADAPKAAEWLATRRLLPELLGDAGYETVRIGKIGHPEKEAAWNGRVPESVERRVPAGRPPALPARGPATLPGAKAVGSGFEYGPSGNTDGQDGDGRKAAVASELLRGRREGDRPLFLALGFSAVHLPFRCPQKYFDMYPPEKMPVPRNPGALPDGMPSPEQWEEIRRRPPFDSMGPNNPHTLEQWREAIAAHYAYLSYADAQIGRVLDAIEESGRADRTVVVLWSDHGFVLGEHFLWRKGRLCNESTGSALIVRAPGVSKAGAACARPVDVMDVFPTLLELAGVARAAGTECTSLAPLLRDPARRAWKKAAVMMGEGGSRSLVTETHRYSEIGRGPGRSVELFDHRAGPGEHRNLAEDPAHAAVREELAGLLRTGWRGCLPAEP